MQGRQLASITTDGNTYTYSYDGDGIRTQKIVDGVTHTYITQNGKVVRESYGNTVMDFIYDNAGNPFALRYSTNGGSSYATYYYVLNLQGDVVKLVRIYAGATIQEYEEMASYTYNAWGEIISSSGSMADINPLRYRGYYYDAETGFYYLRSRYYDPVNCRFINADTPEISAISAISISDTNLFTYCGNNPVNRADDGGEFWNIIVGAVVGAAVGAISAAVNGDNVWIGAAAGAASGALVASGVGVIGQVAGGALIGAAESIADQAQKGKGIDVGEVLFDATVGALSGMSGGINKGVANHIMHQSMNSAKRLVSVAVKDGLKAAGKEMIKAGKYLISQTATITWEKIIKPQIKDGILSFIDGKIQDEVKKGLFN